ncbi:MAG TPA: hypothetical protein VJ761_25095 [Ktedonobacteraceae bacterium]|nr:hypothetical protein [Ktedonobacteraceae bacterium]
MSNNHSEQVQMHERLTNLLHASQIRFGELLREVCEVSGITQGKLSREAKEERQRLIEKGIIHLEDSIGSMEQPTISKVMAGAQEPTYIQVYIWLRVIRTHYESPQFAEICKELRIPLPKFSPELERELWHLSTFVPPDELLQVYEETKNKKLIEIYTPLIEHKELRWDRARRKPTKDTNMNIKSLPNEKALNPVQA